jgi:hypothetical protein
MIASGLCDFKSEGEDCEKCNKPILEGGDVYFVSCDYWSSDGSYWCKACWEYVPDADEIDAMTEELEVKHFNPAMEKEPTP